MANPDPVTLWLSSLTLDDEDDKTTTEPKKKQLGDPKRAKIEPLTPPRRASEAQSSEDPSPISTVFSVDRDLVFDAALQKTYVWHGDGEIYEDVSECTSVDDEDEDEDEEDDRKDDNDNDKRNIKPLILDTAPTPSSLQQPPSQSPSPKPPPTLFSLSPPSSNASLARAETPPTNAPPKPHDASIPRLVLMTSCIQCTLASLPCSRTPPSCTRCIRNGHAETCLLTRRLFLDEPIRYPSHLYSHPGAGGISSAYGNGDGISMGSVVLLKVVGQDEGVVWEHKRAVLERLMGAWWDGFERENWVLPCWGRVGDVSVGLGVGAGGRKRRKRRWMSWEGEGSDVVRELCVESQGWD
ncbi:hypothetical protein LEMA_P018530.1 [Plenodomus lingam JN3]|uniref:Zn(2)-C6 fungal-type domain-containing protein n=1 Tax=Leptosphaeria maculans (strain JN3 / isolate v23.1.3 / race Av1-4-5-6-7-8) TaxID=985895 RepID=E5AAN2_LEPMJ|nr:hypothetical protein LEMA_P018530.1 [Plenodomus lingam JN3]CBY00723.1 hypothetical protein LEMA_P018530.1 [Plenodomus lingam JN3]